MNFSSSNDNASDLNIHLFFQDDGAHSQNEKIDIRNYIEGVCLFIFI